MNRLDCIGDKIELILKFVSEKYSPKTHEDESYLKADPSYTQAMQKPRKVRSVFVALEFRHSNLEMLFESDGGMCEL